MRTGYIIVFYIVFALFLSCRSDHNSENNFQLGTLEIVDYGAVAPDSTETHTTVDSNGKIIWSQYAVHNGIVTGLTSTWEHQLSSTDKSQIEQQCTDADILNQRDVTLPQGTAPCTGGRDMVIHAVSSSGQENRFTISGAARCNSALIPEKINTLLSTINSWNVQLAAVQ